HPGSDFRLVEGKAENDRRRGTLAERKRARELGTHQRRRIVEQHDERALGGGTVVRAEVGIKIGASQGGGSVASLRCGSSARPLQELTNDHGSQPTPVSGGLESYASVDCKPMRQRLIKRLP